MDRNLFSITNDASGYDVARLSPGREPEETGQDLPDLQAAVDTAKDRGAYGELMTPEEALAPSASSDAPAGRTVESAPVLAAEPQAPTEAAPASFDPEEASPYASSPAEELPVSTSPEAAPVQYGGATQGTGAAAEQYADAVGPAGVDPVETWGSPETDSVASEAPAAPSAEIADAALVEAATPLVDEVGTTAGGFPSSAGEIPGNTGAYDAPPSTVDDAAGWTTDGYGTVPEESAPLADGTGAQGGALPGQDAWLPDSDDPAVSPIAAYDDTSNAPVAQAPVAQAGQYDVGAATPEATDTYGLDSGVAATTEDVWQVDDASAPANEVVEAPAAQPELSGYEASWTPSVDDGTTGTGYGADGGYYSAPYDDSASTYDEAPAGSYTYDDGAASSWQPAQDVTVQQGSFDAGPYATDTVPAAQDPATLGTADTLGDTDTSDASTGGSSTWQTSPDLSSWGDDGSGGSFESEPAPVVSAPADDGSGGSFDSVTPVDQSSAPSDGGLSSGSGGGDLSSGSGGGDLSSGSGGGGGSGNGSDDGEGG